LITYAFNFVEMHNDAIASLFFDGEFQPNASLKSAVASKAMSSACLNRHGVVKPMQCAEADGLPKAKFCPAVGDNSQ
jgi:hypothetical protein